jgi:hypothetical protein
MTRSRVELFEEIRRAHDREDLGIRALADRFGVHRRVVRQALTSAIPPPRKVTSRSAPSLDPWKTTIDAWLADDETLASESSGLRSESWACPTSDTNPLSQPADFGPRYPRPELWGVCRREHFRLTDLHRWGHGSTPVQEHADSFRGPHRRAFQPQHGLPQEEREAETSVACSDVGTRCPQGMAHRAPVTVSRRATERRVSSRSVRCLPRITSLPASDLCAREADSGWLCSRKLQRPCNNTSEACPT